MPMMRRGPLERYPTEWVLRQASAHEASGSLEFHIATPLTIYLRAGRICQAVEGVPASGLRTDASDAAGHDEPSARRRVVELLALAMAASDGWYYHDPLGHHDDSSPWRWDTASLLMDARARGHATRSLGPWEDGRVALRDRTAAEGPVALGADAWAVVVQLAGELDAAALGGRLGWPSERLVDALDELQLAGTLDRRRPAAPARTRAAGTPAPPHRMAAVAIEPEGRTAEAPASDEAPVAARSISPATRAEPVDDARGHADGSTTADRRGALRRLISVLKPA